MDQDRAERFKVGDRVTRARLSAGWSKEEAARRAGISPITLKRIEDGLPVQDRKLAAAIRMAEEAELPPEERRRREQARLEAFGAVIDERRERARGRPPVPPVEDDDAAQRREERNWRMVQAELARFPWPDNVDPDNVEAVVLARTMLADYYQSVRYIYEAQLQQTKDTEEVLQFVVGQLDLVDTRLHQIAPHVRDWLPPHYFRNMDADNFADVARATDGRRRPWQPRQQRTKPRTLEEVFESARQSYTAGRAERQPARPEPESAD